MSDRYKATNLREALMDELDAPGAITKSRIRNLLIKFPEGVEVEWGIKCTCYAEVQLRYSRESAMEEVDDHATLMRRNGAGEWVPAL